MMLYRAYDNVSIAHNDGIRTYDNVIIAHNNIIQNLYDNVIIAHNDFIQSQACRLLCATQLPYMVVCSY